MKRKKKVKIGLDFDGVVAYNPFRVVRPLVSGLKDNFLGVKEVKFWVPQKKWQQLFWIILHESSIFPARGIKLFKSLVSEDRIEAHLVTARYSFLDNHLNNWLIRNGLSEYFKTINMNKKNEQPHIFKKRIIDRMNFDVFIEDNWDIVKFLHSKNKKGNVRQTKIFWIYNLFDRNIEFPNKYPYFEKALEDALLI